MPSVTSKKIPPGFEDEKKDLGDRFGDFKIWKQILLHAKQESRPVIFITDDGKDDLWRIHKGRTISPRVELTKEFRELTGKSFYMYSTDTFLDKAGSYLEKPIDQELINEIKNVREQSSWLMLGAAIEKAYIGGQENLSEYLKIKSELEKINFSIQLSGNILLKELGGEETEITSGEIQSMKDLEPLLERKELLEKLSNDLLSRSNMVQFHEWLKKHENSNFRLKNPLGISSDEFKKL